MTAKEKAKRYRDLAIDRAKLAAKYAKSKNYNEAARWYSAADVFNRIAAEFERPTRRS